MKSSHRENFGLGSGMKSRDAIRHQRDLEILGDALRNPYMARSVRYAVTWCRGIIERQKDMTLTKLSADLFNADVSVLSNIWIRKYATAAILTSLATAYGNDADLDAALAASELEQSGGLRKDKEVMPGVDRYAERKVSKKTPPDKSKGKPTINVMKPIHEIPMQVASESAGTLSLPYTPRDAMPLYTPAKFSGQYDAQISRVVSSRFTKHFGGILADLLSLSSFPERSVAQNGLGISYPNYLLMKNGEALPSPEAFDGMIAAVIPALRIPENDARLARSLSALKESFLAAKASLSGDVDKYAYGLPSVRSLRGR